MCITPVLTASDSTSQLRFPPVIVAGRNRMLRYRRGQREMPEAGLLHSSKEIIPAAYDECSPYQGWMGSSELSLDIEVTGCCGKPTRNYTVPVATVDLSDPAELEIPDSFRLKTDVKAAPKIIELKGSAFIDFRVNRTEIDPAYRSNISELTKIIRTIDVVRNNPDATITDISIKGFASPEGSYQNNTRLARERTQALKDYVRNEYSFDESLFHTDFEPEDWKGLRDSVAVSSLPGREGLLRVIDSGLEPDARDAALRKQYPDDYAYLLANVYPALRHSDYVVKYEIRQYTSVDDIRRALRERPENLNEQELLILLGASTPGGDDYDKAVETGAEIFPDNPQLQYLDGVRLARRHEYDKACARLRKAAEGGVKEASKALETLETMRTPQPKVRYQTTINK